MCWLPNTFLWHGTQGRVMSFVIHVGDDCTSDSATKPIGGWFQKAVVRQWVRVMPSVPLQTVGLCCSTASKTLCMLWTMGSLHCDCAMAASLSCNLIRWCLLPCCGTVQ